MGYLRIDRFQAPEVAVDTLNGAMAFLANTDAVIVDLRACTGGNAYMMPWFAGYFVSRPTSLFDMVFRGDHVTERYWTQPWLPGRRLDRQPMYILTRGYFQTLGIPILRGRNFEPADRPDAPPVVIVNQALADQFWPGENALGARLVQNLLYETAPLDPAILVAVAAALGAAALAACLVPALRATRVDPLAALRAE